MIYFLILKQTYAAWEQEKKLQTGLYWQYDVRDAMEETISGGRKEKNPRPSINGYMYGNANAHGIDGSDCRWQPCNHCDEISIERR